MTKNQGQIKFIVVMFNPDMRMITSQFLSRKVWADVQNVLGFESIKNIFSDEKFDAIFTDGEGGNGGIKGFLALVRSSRRNQITPVILVLPQDAKLGAKGPDSDPLCYIWTQPLPESNLVALKEDIDRSRLAQAAHSPQEAAHAKMFDARLLNAVLVAVRDAMALYFTDEKVEFGKPNVRKAPLIERSGISGLIGIEGEKFKGSMVIAASLDFLKQLSDKIFPDQNIKLTKEVSIELVTEVTTHLVSRIKMQFSNLGLASTVKLPEVFIGKRHVVPHKVIDSAIYLGLTVLNSLCEIELTISQASDFIIDESRAILGKKDVVMFE